MERVQFTITNKDNKKIVCDVIATYHDEERNKDFIVYTDRVLDNDTHLKLYYSLYQKKDNKIKLIDIVDNEDKKIGLEIIKNIIKDLK